MTNKATKNVVNFTFVLFFFSNRMQLLAFIVKATKDQTKEFYSRQGTFVNIFHKKSSLLRRGDEVNKQQQSP